MTKKSDRTRSRGMYRLKRNRIVAQLTGSLQKSSTSFHIVINHSYTRSAYSIKSPLVRRTKTYGVVHTNRSNGTAIASVGLCRMRQ